MLACKPAAWPEALDLAAAAWTDADIARFHERRARLLRWGWAEQEAEILGERLVMRDRENDERVSCADCVHYRPSRCSNHRTAGLSATDLGRDLASLLQTCPGFGPLAFTGPPVMPKSQPEGRCGPLTDRQTECCAGPDGSARAPTPISPPGE